MRMTQAIAFQLLFFPTEAKLSRAVLLPGTRDPDQ